MYPSAFGRFVDPSTVVTHFHLKPGDSVADFGAGSGHYMKPLSEAVGTSGKVYLCEIQKNLVEALTTHSHELRLMNVHPVWCDLEAENGTKLSDGALDAGLLSNTLFQLSEKKKALKEFARVIRKGGKLFVIDWTDSFSGLGPPPADVVSEADATALLSEAGFTVERTFPAGDHHYGLACRRE